MKKAIAMKMLLVGILFFIVGFAVLHFVQASYAKRHGVAPVPSKAFEVNKVSFSEGSKWYTGVTIEMKNVSGKDQDLGNAIMEFETPHHVGSSWGNFPQWLGTTVKSDKDTKTGNYINSINFQNQTSIVHPDAVFSISFGQNNTQENGNFIIPNANEIKNSVKIYLNSEPAKQGSIIIRAPAEPPKYLEKDQLPTADISSENGFKETLDNIPWGKSIPVNDLLYGKYTFKTHAIGPYKGSTKEIKLDEKNSEQSVDLDFGEPSVVGKFKLSLGARPDVYSEMIPNPVIFTVKNIENNSEQNVDVSWNSSKEMTLEANHQYLFWGENFSVNEYNFYPSQCTSSEPCIMSIKNDETFAKKFEYKHSVDPKAKEVEITVNGLPHGAKFSLGFYGAEKNYQYTMNPSAGNKVFLDSGTYSITAGDYSDGTNVYKPDDDNPKTIHVVQSGSNKLALAFSKQENNSQVRGWPEGIAMGSVINSGVGGSEYPKLAQRFVYALFTYTGEGGFEKDITDLGKEQRIMSAIQNLESNTDRKYMPVFVIYTSQLSGGFWQLQQDLQPENMKKQFAKLILTDQLFESYKDSAHPFPATMIVNPDFLGELYKDGPKALWGGGNQTMQSLNDFVGGGVKINVKEIIQQAYDYAKQHKNSLGLKFTMKDLPSIPAEFNNPNPTMKDYIAAINWLMKTFAADIPYGWQDNVWSGDPLAHMWLHNTTTALSNNEARLKDINDHINGEITFLNNLEVYSGKYKPDFIAFDKYERDTFSEGNAHASYYIYNEYDWDTYMQFVGGVANELGNIPLMLWQIPGGHLQINGETLDTRNNNGSTAPDYFFGDTMLAPDLSNIKDYIKNANFIPANYRIDLSVKNIHSITGYLNECPEKAQGIKCWHTPHMQQAANSNVFAILWGGGSTTGVTHWNPINEDGGWLYSKIKSWEASK